MKWIWIGSGVVVAGLTALVVAARTPATPTYFAGTSAPGPSGGE